MASQRNGTLYVGVTNNIPFARISASDRRGFDLHEEIPSEDVALVRDIWRRQLSDRARKTIEEMGTQVEARADRAVQSRMARLVRDAKRPKARLRA